MKPVGAIRFPEWNLWRNPFGELTTEERGRLAVCDLSAEVAWLQTASAVGAWRVLQFRGPCGHGKSSHLHALTRQLAGACYLYIPPEPPWPQVPRDGLLIVDEADRIPWRLRRKTIGSRRLCAVGVHQCLKQELAVRGAEVRDVKVLLAGSAEKVASIFNRRIEASIADRSKPYPKVEEGFARELIRRYGDDIRAMERYLYERIQQLAGAHDGQMRLHF